MEPDVFIARWTAREGGAERANYQGFLYDLCELIGVARPDVSGADAARNDYVFERAVRPRGVEANAAPKRIDLYKRGAFILEAKQSRLPGGPKALLEQLILIPDEAPLGKRSTARGWDVMMQNARRQAEAYVGLLDVDHPAPPFLMVCDVGHCIELYADFTGTGRAYQHFPDRQGFRVYIEDLRREDLRDRLKAIWDDPASLDPAKISARVTREIAARLAAVSKVLEKSHPPEEVAHFLMRCIFTMFASSVNLLPKNGFAELLEDCVASPRSFVPMLSELWGKMNEKDSANRFSTALRAHVPYFNGNLYADAKVFPLAREEIGELLAAAKREWREVDPAIFGALLEQALDKAERKRLGAHYTPRAYVQRLVEVTVMEPLRADWQAALTVAEAAKHAGQDKRAVAAVRAFQKTLCATRVLDPACGTGNFLYVALELMKALEGEVLETLARLGEPESMGLDRETVDPHQFLGLELNPRAAAIAELVIWIGYLQQHYRTRTGHPGEPVLRAFKNINGGERTGFDAVLTWDGYPVPAVEERAGKRVEAFPNARRPDWPEAEFIVGNPPFIAGSDMRGELGDGYAAALRKAAPHINPSADFVMQWWDNAAGLLSRAGAVLRRFGLVTTNSITQVLLRRVVERRLDGQPPISIVYAIPDHPWTKASPDSAAVRIAMTAVEAGSGPGRLLETTSEQDLASDDPRIDYRTSLGVINADLSVGVNLTRAKSLRASDGISHDGIKLHGRGFLVSPKTAAQLGLGRREGLDRHLRPYRNGKDLTYRSRGLLALDFLDLASEDVRRRFPEAYQHLTEKVRYDLDEHGKPRMNGKGAKTGREWNNRASYRELWWIFGEPRREMRPALEGQRRFIATVDTARHRVFQFVPAEILLDDKSVVIALSDAASLAILSSGPHIRWAERSGGWLGQGNDPVYTKSRTFDPFPFPDPPPALRARLAAAGEELDALRKEVQAEHPDITLTGLYNVLEKLRAGAELSDKDEDIRRRGLVLIVKELHDTIDRLTHEAYGWPRELSDEAILERLVALNAERAREEEAGLVRWLRPDYQAPRFGRRARARTADLPLPQAPAGPAAKAARPAFPKDPFAQPLAVEAELARAGRPLAAEDLARAFGGSGTGRRARVDQALATLALYGRVTPLGDGRFSASRQG